MEAIVGSIQNSMMLGTLAGLSLTILLLGTMLLLRLHMDRRFFRKLAFAAILSAIGSSLFSSTDWSGDYQRHRYGIPHFVASKNVSDSAPASFEVSPTYVAVNFAWWLAAFFFAAGVGLTLQRGMSRSKSA